ncbi:MAG: hypothetical protein KGN33_16520 [Paracoccaceae bacterium]|nr:hypothetical protein [Paracoccaceae bacterium]
MALSQSQIIQALGEALQWFEKELGWGVAPGELNHLTGRIGELYAAMVTRGQMALATNQRGYDVISAENERISVKTVTTSNHITFNPATFDQVDRIMVLRINVDEQEASIEELLDCAATEAQAMVHAAGGKYQWSVPARKPPTVNVEDLVAISEATYDGNTITQLENGTIIVARDGEQQTPALPTLRKIASRIGVDILNVAGNPKNTRTLGADVIRALQALRQT